ncbi:MAG: SDR family oxidoreductase [Chloroflexota bacterium]|nr:MAG: SDR family oxidoreductase [Chloroflexota bacterium]
MRILVTGGAGLIGSHLCTTLIEAGHDVTVIDNLLTGHRRNIAVLESSPRFHFLQRDVLLPIEPASYEAVFHLASPASPVGYGRYPIETMLVNSQGTLNALEAARRSGASFLLTSTSEIYGDPVEHPQTETYWGNVNSVGPRCCYDEGKRYAEALTINYVWNYGLNARIVRIFNTYGPHNDPEDGRIIPNFINQALHNEPITVYGDGRQTRSFCFVSDLVSGIMRAMFCEETCGEVFNIGNPDEYAVQEIADVVKRITNSSSPIIHTDARDEEIARRRPDISKARAVLGWQPTVPLEEGLRQTVEWFKSLVPA